MRFLKKLALSFLFSTNVLFSSENFIVHPDNVILVDTIERFHNAVLVPVTIVQSFQNEQNTDDFSIIRQQVINNVTESIQVRASAYHPAMEKRTFMTIGCCYTVTSEDMDQLVIGKAPCWLYYAASYCICLRSYKVPVSDDTARVISETISQRL